MLCIPVQAAASALDRHRSKRLNHGTFDVTKPWRTVKALISHQGKLLRVCLRGEDSERARPVLRGIVLSVGSLGEEISAQPRILVHVLISIASVGERKGFKKKTATYVDGRREIDHIGNKRAPIRRRTQYLQAHEQVGGE